MKKFWIINNLLFFLKKKIVLLIIVFPSVFFGQKNIRNSIEICTAISNFNNINEANDILDKILNASGLQKNFSLYPCDGVDNAVAFTINGDRYIFYNEAFMNLMSKRTNDLSNIFILAHEVGHHINFHTKDLLLIDKGSVPQLAEKRRQELEADEFAAFVMAKMGYKLSDIKETLKNSSSDWRTSYDKEDDTYSTHPKIFDRLQAVNTGFFKSYDQEGVKYLTTLELADLAESKFISEDYWGALSYYSQAQERLWIPYGDFMKGRCYYELKKYEKAIKMFDSAIKGLDDNGFYYYYRAEAKKNISDKDGSCNDYLNAYKFAENGWNKQDVASVKSYLLDLINLCD